MKLEVFYKQFIENIKSLHENDEEGISQEQLFTDEVTDLLTNGGETENVRIKFDKREDKIGRTIHKINAYRISENYETLDLFISDFRPSEAINTISKSETEVLYNQITKFFHNAVYKEYADSLEESSEIFDLANTLYESDNVKEFLSRVNVFILTNRKYKSDFIPNRKIKGFPVFARIIDIEYIYNLADKEHVPIEIDFSKYEEKSLCIKSSFENNSYESYIALIPAGILTSIYEEYGSRLLEQNIRSFLQFRGKINQGIKNTILNEPEMFLAYNNGISITADSVITEKNSENLILSKIIDLQIVNGGQTTASLFHVSKKEKAELNDIYIQAKISVIKEKDKYSEIVSNITRFANTQNRVSASDFSSNHPFHVKIELLSRKTWVSNPDNPNMQTRWFYERSRGQYNNERMKYGTTKSGKKAFDARNPKKQLLNKELTAKYYNTCNPNQSIGKWITSPNIVVRGSQKNYQHFIDKNLSDNPTQNLFYDIVAMALIFKTAESVYGVKPNSIGDLRYVTVPYSISYLIYYIMTYKAKKIDYYKIYLNQKTDEKFNSGIRKLMIKIESEIKNNAPGSLYAEYAKKLNCWTDLIQSIPVVDIDYFMDYLIDINQENPKRPPDEYKEEPDFDEGLDIINSIPLKIWDRILAWGTENNNLHYTQIDLINSLKSKIRLKKSIPVQNKKRVQNILDNVIKYAPELLEEIEEDKNYSDVTNYSNNNEIIKIDQSFIKSLLKYNRKICANPLRDTLPMWLPNK